MGGSVGHVLKVFGPNSAHFQSTIISERDWSPTLLSRLLASEGLGIDDELRGAE